MADKRTAPEGAKKPNILMRLLALLVTAALVLGALALVVYRDRFNLDALKRYLAYRTMETTETGEAVPFNHAGGNKMSISHLGGGVLTASATGARYYALDGTLYAEEVLPLENPVLSASSSTGVVYNAGGQSLFVFQNGQEISDLSLEEGIDLLSVRPNDSGWLAVTAQQSGYKGAVTVYDSHHQKVISISLSSTFVVDAAVSPDCKTVAVVTMDQQGGSFYSRLLFYPVDQSEPSAQVELGNIVCLDLDYESGRVWVLGEDSLLIADEKGEAVQTYSFSRAYLKGCDLEGEGFALLLTGPYRAGSATQALIIDREGQVVQTMDLSGQVLDYSAAGNYWALLTGSALTIYTSTGQEPYALLESLQGARYVDLSRDGSALLASAQQAWLYLPN